MIARLYSLDYLRGLAAFGIMIYHYLFWIQGAFTSDSFMGRVGVYGVAIFYVLSGLTLYHVYEYSTSKETFSIGSFIRKRIYRIFPLLWLVTIIAILISRKAPNLVDVFLNLTGLFGFIRWDVYFSTGAWSIGNELVFYSIFPFILFACMKRPVFLAAIIAAAFGLHHYFAYYVLHPSLPLSEQWRDYVNPLNQIFFFVAGIAIGHFTKARLFPFWCGLSIILIGFLLFTFIPAEGNTATLITEDKRWMFTLASLLICLGAYKMTGKLPSILHGAFKLLGEASYSVYLLHPLVFAIWAFAFHRAEARGIEIWNVWKLVVPIAATLLLSYYVYFRYERYFIKKGHQSSPGSPS
jgi:exopolysaccharide production protein ExoZ